MKKILPLFAFILTVTYVSPQETSIPDLAFEQALIDLGIDSDGMQNGEVLTADISGITNLDVSSSGILNLTGIEDFAALQILNCSDNNLFSLDVTQNANLTELDCSNNANIGAIDVSQNPDLAILRCANSNLTALDVTSNLFLLELYAGSNMLTGLDTSFNAGLGILQCNDNQITALDVTTNALLTQLFCENNNLEGQLNLSQNPLLTDFNVSNNPSLYCIQVANAADADAGAGIYATWTKDGFAVYSENCSDLVTHVPDDAFEQYLIDQGIDAQLDNYVIRANVEMITSVDVSSLGITDLTGIEDFSGLEELYCSGNSLSSLDVSQNTTLFVLECADNQLTSLMLNTTLFSLLCNDNQLTDIDVSQNPNLITLNCSNNELLGSLFVSGLPSLTSFNSTNNPMLVCIQVDDEVEATAAMGQYTTWMKDLGAFYSEDCVASSDNFSIASLVVVYPNPASSEIRIDMPYQLEKAAIYNIQGQRIMENASEIINIEKLPEGLYFVKIQTQDNKRATKKLVVSY